MTPKRILAALIVTAGLVLAPRASAADAFLKFDGVEGESKHQDHKGEIEVDSLQIASIQDAVARASRSGSGGGKGKVSFQDIHFTKQADKSSPVLMKAATTGKHFPTVVFTCRKAGGGQQEYIRITLKDVFVTSFQAGGPGGGGGAPRDSFALRAGAAEFDVPAAPKVGTVPTGLTAPAGLVGVTGVPAPSGRVMPPNPVSPAAAAVPAAAGTALVQPTPAPPKITGASAAAPFTGLSATLTIASTGPCRNAFVDWGDGSIAEGHALTGTSTTLPPHAYPSAGPKTIKVGGRDAPYWPAPKKAPQSHANDCIGWAPEVNVTLNSAAVAAPAVRK